MKFLKSIFGKKEETPLINLIKKYKGDGLNITSREESIENFLAGKEKLTERDYQKIKKFINNNPSRKTKLKLEFVELEHSNFIHIKDDNNILSVVIIKYLDDYYKSITQIDNNTTINGVIMKGSKFSVNFCHLSDQLSPLLKYLNYLFKL